MEVLLIKKLILVALVACVVTAVLTTIVVRAQNEQPVDRHVVAGVVQSTVLSEQRDVTVTLPESYQRDAARRYPVLYVLDGSSQSPHTAESARLLARIGVMPEIIVVGVPSSGENRARDYTPPYMRADPGNGQAKTFLRFLETELIPHIEQAYRTTSTRMLAGHSRGGLFVIYSLLEKPDLFSARLAFSPALWRDDDRIIAELVKARMVKPAFLYLSLGDGENPKMTRAFRKAVNVMRTSAPPPLRWRADITGGANHDDNAVFSTPVALHEYYRIPPASGHNQTTQHRGGIGHSSATPAQGLGPRNEIAE
jgi:predicted alpha/beta superfamily hydrolase